MNRDQPRSHADGAPPAQDVAEPSLAEKARTLTHQGGHSTLSTMSRKHAGFPFGSLMPYGLTAAGEPTFLVSSMAMHTRNVLEDPHATLLIVQAAGDGNPLGAGRISLMGDVLPVDENEERAAVQIGYVERNPSARNYLQFDDFRFFKLHLLDIYFVGGFGVMGWISADDFRSAKPDPLVDVAAGIIQHMNEDHRESMAQLAIHHYGLAAEDAEMLSVDRLGFNLRVRTRDGMKGVRLAYDSPAESADAVRHALIGMVRASKA